jgi:hypothetical protein
MADATPSETEQKLRGGILRLDRIERISGQKQ